MIDLNAAIYVHGILIDEFGGSKGVRDLGGLEAALARPYATFDQQDLYPTVIDKASAIFESLIINHPFIDGNKRIAYVLMRLVLIKYGFDIIADYIEKYEMTISASMGDCKFDDIKQWLSVHLKNNDQ